MSAEILGSEPDSTTKLTRMLIVDCDPDFREIVCATIARNDTPVALSVASSVTNARQAMVGVDFDVAFINMGLPAGGCMDIIREISNTRADASMIMVAVFADKAQMMASFESSEAGYLIMRAPANAPQGKDSPTTPSLTPPLPIVVDDNRVSSRQRQVLSLLAKGFTDDEIAKLLKLSPHTVSTHVKKLYRKLGVHSRAEAVFEGGRSGLL